MFDEMIAMDNSSGPHFPPNVTFRWIMAQLNVLASMKDFQSVLRRIRFQHFADASSKQAAIDREINTNFRICKIL